jgi:replicative DNA helicase
MQPLRPPHNLEAEQALLGAILIDSDGFERVRGKLSACDFYSERHGWIWDAAETLRTKRRRIDYVTICEELDRCKRLDTITSGYVTSLIASTPTSSFADDYADIVINCSKRRSLIGLAGDIATAAFNLESDIDNERAKWLTALVKTAQVKAAAEPLQKFIAQAVDEMEAMRQNPRAIYGMATGIAGFDRWAKGFHAKETVIITGVSGIGKSLLSSQIMAHLGLSGMVGIYYAMEMTGLSIARRLLSGMSGVPTDTMRGGLVTEREYDAVIEQAGILSSAKMFLSDGTHWTTSTLRADLSRLQSEHGASIAVIDHVDKLRDTHKDKNQLDAIVADELHNIAKDLSMCIVILAPVNKSEELSGSNMRRHEADVILQMAKYQSPNNYERAPENIRTCLFVKGREGATGKMFNLAQVYTGEHSLPMFQDWQGSKNR